MGIHVGSFTLGGIVGAGVMGYLVMKSPIGDEVKSRVVNVLKKETEEGIHFLLWGDKRDPGYKDYIIRDEKGRPDYTSYAIKSKYKKVNEVYFITEYDARNAFSAIHDLIEEYGSCSIANFLEVAKEYATEKSIEEVETEYSDCKYGWDKGDLAFFNKRTIKTRYIPGKGCQFWFPCVHKIGV